MGLNGDIDIFTGVGANHSKSDLSSVKIIQGGGSMFLEESMKKQLKKPRPTKVNLKNMGENDLEKRRV